MPPLPLWSDSGSEPCRGDALEALEAIFQRQEDAFDARLAGAREQQNALTATCTVCAEEARGGAFCSTTLTGTAPHYLCKDCIPRYVESSLDQDAGSNQRQMERRERYSTINCPCSARPLDCDGLLDDMHVLPYLDRSLRQRFLDANDDDRAQRWEAASMAAEENVPVEQALRHLLPNAIQCGRCSYGPIDHSGCDDLCAHHGEWHGNVQVRNECPRCGWWAYDRGSWPRWDGVYRA